MVEFADYDAIGRTAANLTFNAGRIFFGEGAAPRDDKEAEFVAGAYRDYFASKGISDFTPGAVLAIALVTYAVPRMSEPTVREKIAAGVRSLWGKAKGAVVR